MAHGPWPVAPTASARKAHWASASAGAWTKGMPKASSSASMSAWSTRKGPKGWEERQRPGRWEDAGKTWEYMIEIWWEDDGKIMGKLWECDEKMMGLSGEDDRKMMGMWWEDDGIIMWRWWEYDGNIWKNTMGIFLVYTYMVYMLPECWNIQWNTWWENTIYITDIS